MGPRQSLNQYINAVRNKPFEWGKNDCLTFTNGAFHAMYGKGWADDWLDRYLADNTPIRRNELIKEFGFRSFSEAVDQRLNRIDHIPPLGALVTTKHAEKWIIGVAMGISTGTRAVFLSKKGVIHFPMEYVHEAWVL
jgi:hypothetical protein